MTSSGPTTRSRPPADPRVRSEVASLDGTDHLETATIRNIATGAEQTAPATAMFVFIGAIPHTGWLRAWWPATSGASS